MSKAAKQSIVILVFLLLGSFAFGGFTVFEKQKVEKAKLIVEKELNAAKSREKTYILEAKDFKAKIKAAEEAKAAAEGKLAGIDKKIKGLNDKINEVSKSRSNLEDRVNILQKERDGLLAKLEEKPEPKIVYKYIEKEPSETEGPQQPEPKEITLDPENLEGLGDDYWAEIIKEKAALEVELDSVNRELSNTLVELEETNKKNTNLTLELSKIKTEKETIEREVKNGKDLADRLSLDLARSKSDKRFVSDQLDKSQNENGNLRIQVKDLTTTKIALEKSIIRLNDEKNDLNKKLVETENVIQGKIEEIWEIKESLKDKIGPDVSLKEIELPPIIVSAGGSSSDENEKSSRIPVMGPGYNGNVVSINSENNFVIVDIGQSDGVTVGDKLGIYREADYIGEIEIIQVRADISAADIKQQASSIKVGDAVK